MSATFSISRTANNISELSLQGRLNHPHWVAFLSTGLAESQISVVSGHALVSELHEWDAKFMLDFSRSQALPEMLDYVALAQRKSSAVDMLAPRLSRFEISRLADDGLEVQLQGPDQIGFLSRLLGRMSLLMLFPTEIDINTVNGQIKDRFVFRGVAGLAADDSARAALETMMRSFVA